MTSTASVTSSTSSARSNSTFVSTAMSARWLWLTPIIQPHGFVAKRTPLGLRQLVAPRAELGRLQGSGCLLQASRFAHFHHSSYLTTALDCQLGLTLRPEGLLEGLSPENVMNLFAYLP